MWNHQKLLPETLYFGLSDKCRVLSTEDRGLSCQKSVLGKLSCAGSPHKMVEHLGASDVIDMVLTVTWLLELLEAHRAT